MRTFWYPDTCSCVIEQLVNANGEVFDFAGVVACPLHAGLASGRDLALLILQFHRNKRDYVKSLNLPEGVEAIIRPINGDVEVESGGIKRLLKFRTTLRTAIGVSNG